MLHSEPLGDVTGLWGVSRQPMGHRFLHMEILILILTKILSPGRAYLRQNDNRAEHTYLVSSIEDMRMATRYGPLITFDKTNKKIFYLRFLNWYSVLDLLNI